MQKLISIIVPILNEEKNIPIFYAELSKVINQLDYNFEIIFVDDGSSDGSLIAVGKIMRNDNQVKLIEFSRNFGKEIAMTAGINQCLGEACLILDADLQHPIEKIPEFILKWENGAEVVVGVRKKNKGEGFIKKFGSFFFYKIINRISDMEIISRATDFRLLDRIVIDEFNKLKEKNRMTRLLIDWLGFRREFIYFEAKERLYGKPAYSLFKLIRLAFNSVVSLSLFPLRLAGYSGIVITILSAILAIFMFVANYAIEGLDFSGPAILAVIILFLIGIVLICLGLIALYIANIHGEVCERPMYIIRKAKDKIQSD